jgi:hypothetical protein
MRAAALILFLMLILPAWAAEPQKSSSFGLRTTGQCDSDPTIIRDSQLMSCYRAAAITSAFAGDKDTAQTICGNIYYKLKGTASSEKSDTATKAAMVSNSCYNEVAKIFRDVEICGKIVRHNDLETGLFGEEVTKQLCMDQVTNLAKLNTGDYYADPNHTNICTIIFIVPALLVGALRYGRY